jgi:hypothetical protein
VTDISLRDRLREQAAEAAGLARRLELVIAVRSRTASSGSRGKVDHSQPPWNAAVANAILDLHAEVRLLEQGLRAELGLPARTRGGSQAGTITAITALCRLSEGVPDASAWHVLRALSSWCRRAQIALQEKEVPRGIPRAPGAPEPRCPFCASCSLRAFPLRGEITCISPACPGDDQGRRARAQLEFSPVARDWVLVWQDGVAGVPA